MIDFGHLALPPSACWFLTRLTVNILAAISQPLLSFFLNLVFYCILLHLQQIS